MKQIHSLLSGSPFRMLGIWSNGSVREITSNAGRIKAFAKVHKKASFKSDLENFLGVIERSEEDLIKAQTAIHLPADRLKAVLFWFVKADNIDAMALDYLTKAQMVNDSYAQKALELWSKRTTPSSLLNLAVFALMSDDLRKAVEKYLQFLRRPDTYSTFLPQVVPDADSRELTKSAVLKIVLDQLMQVASDKVLENLLSDSGESVSYFADRKSGRVNEYLNQMEVICSHYKYTLENLTPDDWADYVSERVYPFIELARKMQATDGNVVNNQHYLKFMNDTLEFIEFYTERIPDAEFKGDFYNVEGVKTVFIGLLNSLTHVCNAEYQHKCRQNLDRIRNMSKIQEALTILEKIKNYTKQYEPDRDGGIWLFLRLIRLSQLLLQSGCPVGQSVTQAGADYGLIRAA